MMRHKKVVEPTRDEQLVAEHALQFRRYFFKGNSAVAVSNLVVCMAAGAVMAVEALPTELLPAVVLLATIGIRSYNQQIVDDYELLLARMEDVFKHKQERDILAAAMDASYVPEPWPWHPQINLASSISLRGARGEYTLVDIPEAQYMFQVYEELVNAEVEGLFQGIACETQGPARKADKAKRRP